jgi:hypothetical protein
MRYWYKQPVRGWCGEVNRIHIWIYARISCCLAMVTHTHSEIWSLCLRPRTHTDWWCAWNHATGTIYHIYADFDRDWAGITLRCCCCYVMHAEERGGWRCVIEVPLRGGVREGKPIEIMTSRLIDR